MRARDALEYLGLRSEVIEASARVEHAPDGAVEHVGECQNVPIVQDDGNTNGHVVLRVESSRRLVDPTILQLQHLYTVAGDNISFGVPVVVPLPSVDSLSNPVSGIAVECYRSPLVISWVPQPRWVQAINPVPGSNLDVGLAYGKLTLAHATLELIRGLQKLGSDMDQMDTDFPVLASLLDGGSHLPGLPSEPPDAFLRVCHSSEASR